MRRFPAVLAAAVAAATLAAAGMAPALAATSTGWRVVFTHHYGAAANYSSYDAAVAPGPAEAWEFGTTNGAGVPAPGTPVAEHWAGGKWSATALPAGLKSEIIATSAASARSVWAVTEAGGDILHWNGSHWSIAEHVAGSGMFTDVVAVSPSDVWAFGRSRVGPSLGTWHFNGTSWAHVSGLAGQIADASAVSANNIWAVALTATVSDVIVHFNGSTWRTVQAPALSGLSVTAILALTGTNVWAVAVPASGSGGSLLVHLSHGKWTQVKSPWPYGFIAMAPDGAGGLWLSASPVPGYTWLVHRSASGRWSRTRTVGFVGVLTLIPGSTALWGGGLRPAASGSDAAIWAYGKI